MSTINYFDSRYTNAQLAEMLERTHKAVTGEELDTTGMGRCTLAAKLEDLDKQPA